MSTLHEAPKPPCSPNAPLYLSVLPALRAGTLAQPEREALRQHLQVCPVCREQALVAADQVVADGVLRHFGVPTATSPFLTLDDIRRRAELQATDKVSTNHHKPVFLHDRGKSMAQDDTRLDAPTRDEPNRTPTKLPNRWRLAAGVVATLTIIALFALLLRGFVVGKGSPGPAGTDGTATVGTDATQTTGQTPPAVHGKWQVVDAMGYTSPVFTQIPHPEFSPVDSSIVYEATLSPSLRRSDDGGATWTALNLPPSSTQLIDIEIFASPLDAHTAFLTMTANLAYGQGTSACPSSARASVSGTHGPILASGQVPCSTTYRTTDAGTTWKAIRFPVNGTISTPLSDSAAYAGTPVQAQGTKLFALLSCGPSCVSPGGRLVSSVDGGGTWRVADGGGLGTGLCDFTARPDSQTVFAAAGHGGCDALNSPALSLYRSDNGGAGWYNVGTLAQGAVQGMASATVDGTSLLILNLANVTWQPHIINVTLSPSDFRVSSDGGRTWKIAPTAGVPEKAQPVVAPLIVRADGSLVVAFTGDGPSATKLYSWKPGEASWHVFAPLPDGMVSTVLRTGSASGDEMYWAVLRSDTGAQSTFTVAKYLP